MLHHLQNFRELRDDLYQDVSRRSNEEVAAISQEEMVTNLRELFDEIDINGDKYVEWDEFTSFVVSKAGMTNTISLDAITEYEETLHDAKLRSAQNKPLAEVYYIQPLDAVAIWDETKPAVRLHAVENYAQIGELKSAEMLGPPTSMAYIGKNVNTQFEPVGRLAMACADSSIAMWNLSDDKKQFRMHTRWPTPHMQLDLHWYAREKLLFSASVVGLVHAWEVESRQEITCLQGHTDMVMGLCSLPSLDSIASCSLDRTISIWDVHTGARRQLLQGHSKGITSLACDENHRLLFSAGFNHDAYVWSPFTPTVLFKLKGHSCPLVGVQTVPSANQVITADIDGWFRVWDVRTFQCVQSFTTNRKGPIDKGVEKERLGEKNVTTDFVLCRNRPYFLTRDAKSAGTARLVATSQHIAFFEQRPVNVDTGVADDVSVQCALYNATLVSIITAHGSSVKIWNA